MPTGHGFLVGPGLLATLCLAGCQFSPTDRFTLAEYAARRGEFLSALGLLDQVSPSHFRYSEARTFAQALERRIRTSHEMILEGLALRTEWRDEAAIERFEQALAIWSDVAGAEGLIRATRHRIAVLGTRRDGEARRHPGTGTGSPAELPAVDTTPLELPGVASTTSIGSSNNGSMTAGQVTDPAAPPVFTQTGNPAPGPEIDPTTVATGATAVAQPTARSLLLRAKVRRARRLATARRLLDRGDRDSALLILQDLWDEAPTDVGVVTELSRVLHQRALLAYGQGVLEAAIDDWRKVVRLQQKNTQARAFLRAAQTELARRSLH